MPPPAAARPRRTLLGTSLRAAAAAIVLTPLIWLVWTNVDWNGLWRKPPVAVVPATKEPDAQPAKPVSLSREATVLEAQKSVVLLEADGPGGLIGVGAGVVIDSSGLVATSYHLSSDLTAGMARLQDGRVFAIAGYAAVDPASDLAILQLENATGLPAAKIQPSAKLQPLTGVVAIGHPRGVEFALHDGVVSRRIRTSRSAAKR